MTGQILKAIIRDKNIHIGFSKTSNFPRGTPNACARLVMILKPSNGGNGRRLKTKSPIFI